MHNNTIHIEYVVHNTHSNSSVKPIIEMALNRIISSHSMKPRIINQRKYDTIKAPIGQTTSSSGMERSK